MANNNGEAKGCSFLWQIKNVSHLWWVENTEIICSTPYIAAGLGNTKWSLSLYTAADDKKFMELYLHREYDCNGGDSIEICYEFEFLGKVDSILKKEFLMVEFRRNDSYGWPNMNELEGFLLDDTLTIRCTMWMSDPKPVKSNHLFATTDIKLKRRNFVWRIDKTRSLESKMSTKFIDYLIGFDLVLNGYETLDINITPIRETIRYISCITSVIDLERRKVNCEIKKYFADDLKEGVRSSTLIFPQMVIENKSLYYPNDVLTLDFEIVISSIEHSDCSEYSSKVESHVFEKEAKSNMIDDFGSLYKDSIFCDTKIRTKTKTFLVHKAVLSARSPVFRSMFSQDMMEKNSGLVVIEDFDDDTIHQMLLYIYSDSLKDLRYESACQLYAIADKYMIRSLRSRCSSYFKENLCPENVLGILVLADIRNDNDLKIAMEDYILRQHKRFFCSQEWIDFMSNHRKLAADVMYRRINKSTCYEMLSH